MSSWFDRLPRADARFGFPPNLSDAFAQTATALNATVLVRAPGEAGTQLLDERYDAKGFFIKGKSCNWGPMSGFVCMNPLLNKNGSGGWAFNREKHRDYLETLLWYIRPGGVKGILAGNMNRYPRFPEGESPNDAALEDVIATAGRPLWISEDRLARLQENRTMTPGPGYYKSSIEGSVGIAVDDRKRPSVALEFAIRRAPQAKLWALYQGVSYQRGFGDVIAVDRDKGQITLDTGQGAAFPQGNLAPFFVRLEGPKSLPYEALRVTANGDVLTFREASEPPQIVAGWKVESDWRVGAADRLLNSVSMDGIEPRAEFMRAYENLVMFTDPSGDEANALGGMRDKFREDFTSEGLGGLPIVLTPMRFWPIIGLQNPFPPNSYPPARTKPDLTYLDAVTGDFDLAAVWPANAADEEIVRVSEMRWEKDHPPRLNQAPGWWLSAGMPLFVPMDSKPFAVQSTRLPGLIIEFIPSEQQLESYRLESGEWGNASNIVLAAVQWANSFAAEQYGQGKGSNVPVRRNDPKIRNPPNVAFHGDEGGLRGIEDFDWPFAGFLPRQLFRALGNPVGNFVLSKPAAGEAPGNPLDDFLSAVAQLAPMSRVLVHSVWLRELLQDDTRANRVIWLLIRGVAEEPPLSDPRVTRLPADFTEVLRKGLRNLVAPVPQDDEEDEGRLPGLPDLPVQAALTLTVPVMQPPGQGNPGAS